MKRQLKIASAVSALAILLSSNAALAVPSDNSQDWQEQTNSLGGFTAEITTVLHDPTAVTELAARPERLLLSPRLGGTSITVNLAMQPVGTVSGSQGIGPSAFDSNSKFSRTTNCLNINAGHALCQNITTGSFASTGENLAFQTGSEIDLSKIGGVDNHELIIDPKNGNYWAIQYEQHPCTDKPALCGTAKPHIVQTYFDCRVISFDDEQKITYSWRASEHLPTSELRINKWAAYPVGGLYETKYADPYHCNSVDLSPDGKNFLVSMRHTDSIYSVNVASSKVSWKIGGNYLRGKSLRFSGKLFSSVLGGQHDARFQGNSAVSVFDNGTGYSRPGRGIVFGVKPALKQAKVTATMSDPLKAQSRCTGSFRPSADQKYWVAEWGCSTSGMAVFSASGKPLVSAYFARSEHNLPLINTPFDFLATSFGYRAVFMPQNNAG